MWISINGDKFSTNFFESLNFAGPTYATDY